MKCLIALCVFLLAMSVAQARCSSDSNSEESRVLALENAWNLAEEENDAKALVQILGENLEYTDYDGTLMNKAQFLASVKKKSPAYRPEQIVNESMTIHMYGDAAVVTGIYRDKGTSHGKPYNRRGRFTDTWIKQNGNWQCVASQSTLIRH